MAPAQSDTHIFDHIEERDYTGLELLEKWTVPTASVVLRTEFVSKIPVNKDFWCEDIICWLTMASYGKIHAFSREMSTYRILETGAVSTLYRQDFKMRIPKLKRHELALREAFPAIISKANCKEHIFLLDYQYWLGMKDAYGKWRSIMYLLSLSPLLQIKILIYYLKYRRKVQCISR